MVLRKELYRDMEKFQRTRNKQRKRYYGQTQKYAKRIWTTPEMDLINNSGLSDRELSEKIQRSIGAIQARRHIMKKNGTIKGE